MLASVERERERGKVKERPRDLRIADDDVAVPHRPHSE
jgi:hypothetical protein